MKWKLGEFEDGLGYFYNYLRSVFNSHVNQTIIIRYDNIHDEKVRIDYANEFSIMVSFLDHGYEPHEILYDDMLVYPFFSTEECLGINVIRNEG